MNRFLFITLLALPWTYLGFGQSETAIYQTAGAFSTALSTGDYGKAATFFSTKLSDQIDPGKLETIWQQLQNQLGDFQHTETITEKVEDEVPVTYQPMQFKTTLLDLKLSFDSEQKIIGMFFVPHQVFELALTDTDLFFEEEIQVVTNKDISLRGIITLPKNKTNCPAVVLVHGSGPQDMDETIGPNKLFKDLAHGLAQQGIAVIRYEKRTKAYGGSSKIDMQTFTLYEETIEDAISAVELARKDKRIDSKKIFVLGHSLGAMCAPKIAELSKHTKGIIMMAGNARPLQTLILEQYNYLFNQDGLIDSTEQAQLDDYVESLKALENLKNGHAETAATLPLNLPPVYWQSLLNYDQVETAKSLNKPMLIIQGKRDYQVTVEDFDLWNEALKNKPDMTFILYDKLNHVMRSGEAPSVPEEYMLKAALPEYVISDLTNWILGIK